MTGIAGQRLGLPDLAAQFQAVFARNHDVEKEKSGTLALGFGEDGVSGGKDFDREAGAFQMMAHEAGNIGIVFDDGDAGFHGKYCSRKSGLDLGFAGARRAGSAF